MTPPSRGSLRTCCWLLAAAPLLLPGASAEAAQTTLAAAVGAVEAALPGEPQGFAALARDVLETRAREVDRLAAERISATSRDPRAALEAVEQLLAAKLRVDAQLEALLGLRARFVELPAGDERRATLRNYLWATSQLIDLSGRLRYAQFDAINGAVVHVEARAADCLRLLERLTAARSDIGAAVVSPWLFDPPARERDDRAAVRERVIELFVAAGDVESVKSLAAFVLSDVASPGERVAAAQAIRALGLPQDPRPQRDPTLPEPAITARELYAALDRIDPSRLNGAGAERRIDLMRWLDVCIREGVTDDAYRIGNFEVQPGDWLLMRNPSPYNLFTDLSPGLFTHVGIVAAETGSDGIRRMVLVDLPELGSEIPATAVETYLERTLHYVFLRHDDPEVGRAMGRAAASIIGNESEFDLNFRTETLAPLRGQPLDGKKVKTYCAGLLLLAAQQTERPTEDFFPIADFPAGGMTLENVGTLGISVGDHFVSPTGALFSPRLQIVGRRQPMYDPRREIEEAIYDHFATSLDDKVLTPSPDFYQSLRQKVAEAAQLNPLLEKALARAAGVSADMDLVAAAKAAAVVETLDEIAYGASGDFLDARTAVRTGSFQQMQRNGVDREQIDRYRLLRDRHALLYQRWQRGQLSPRELRIALVNYYIGHGRRQIDERFFRPLR